jgi:NAD(P)-dependent dehydrogenase (short-subunit alcohol dehydrogenase family)
MADGGGRVVNVASIVGFTGYSGLSVYGATKASMLGFTRSLAREVGRMGVTSMRLRKGLSRRKHPVRAAGGSGQAASLAALGSQFQGIS